MLVRKCVRSCGAALCATVIAGSALAADYYTSSSGNYGGYKDLPAKAPGPSWQGLYLGVSGGWSWTSINAANNVLILTNNGTVPFSSPAPTASSAAARLATMSNPASSFMASKPISMRWTTRRAVPLSIRSTMPGFFPSRAAPAFIAILPPGPAF